jgi:hypothetical protein
MNDDEDGREPTDREIEDFLDGLGRDVPSHAPVRRATLMVEMAVAQLRASPGPSLRIDVPLALFELGERLTTEWSGELDLLEFGVLWEEIQHVTIRLSWLSGEGCQGESRTVAPSAPVRFASLVLEAALAELRASRDPHVRVDLVLALFELGERLISRSRETLDGLERRVLGEAVVDANSRLWSLWVDTREID